MSWPSRGQHHRGRACRMASGCPPTPDLLVRNPAVGVVAGPAAGDVVGGVAHRLLVLAAQLPDLDAQPSGCDEDVVDRQQTEHHAELDGADVVGIHALTTRKPGRTTMR